MFLSIQENPELSLDLLPLIRLKCHLGHFPPQESRFSDRWGHPLKRMGPHPTQLLEDPPASAPRTSPIIILGPKGLLSPDENLVF